MKDRVFHPNTPIMCSWPDWAAERQAWTAPSPTQQVLILHVFFRVSYNLQHVRRSRSVSITCFVKIQRQDPPCLERSTLQTWQDCESKWMQGWLQKAWGVHGDTRVQKLSGRVKIVQGKEPSALTSSKSSWRLWNQANQMHKRQRTGKSKGKTGCIYFISNY